MKHNDKERGARAVRSLKKQTTDAERLHLWQQTAAAQGLSGEFALAARIGAEPYSEEQARMVAVLFGR